MITDEAVEMAREAYLSYKGTRVMHNARDAMRAALEAAAPYMLRDVWQSAYNYGVDDERTSQANPGIAGCFCNTSPCQCFIAPARVNPYEDAK